MCLDFWICFECTGVSKCYICIGFWIKYFIIYFPGFIKKQCIIDVWQSSEYSSGSEYTRILNMPGLHKILKTCCTLDAWQDPEYSSGSEYGRVLNMPGLHKVLNKTLHYILNTVLNMPPLVPKWQGCRELWVRCKLYSRDLRYSEYASGSQFSKILHVSRILIY